MFVIKSFLHIFTTSILYELNRQIGSIIIEVCIVFWVCFCCVFLGTSSDGRHRTADTRYEVQRVCIVVLIMGQFIFSSDNCIWRIRYKTLRPRVQRYAMVIHCLTLVLVYFVLFFKYHLEIRFYKKAMAFIVKKKSKHTHLALPCA